METSPSSQSSLKKKIGNSDQKLRKSRYQSILNALKMKFSTKGFFSKCDYIRRFLRIWSYLLKKSLVENFIFLCSVWYCPTLRNFFNCSKSFALGCNAGIRALTCFLVQCFGVTLKVLRFGEFNFVTLKFLYFYFFILFFLFI